MILTDAQAGTKWCPLLRFVPLGAESDYKVITSREAPNYSHCIGSKCALWRFHRSPRLSRTTYINASNAEQCLGIIMPPEPDHSDFNALSAYWTSIESALAKLHLKAEDYTKFPKPSGEGWSPAEPPRFIGQGDGEDIIGWVMDWERATDPDATGFCGFGGAPQC